MVTADRYRTKTDDVVLADGAAVERDYLLVPRADVDGNGQIDAVDVQLVINEALDIPTGYDCDVNQDGDVNALDVQLVINAALRLKHTTA